MSKLSDRASYLKGLAAGMKLDKEKNSNKLILEILDLLGDITLDMETITDAHDELNRYVESIDDDLSDMEDALFGDEDGHSCDCCDGDCDEDDDDDDEDDDDDDEDDDDEDGDNEMISYTCPSCGHEIVFNASDVDFDEEYLCPACGKPVFPEFSDEDVKSDKPEKSAEDTDEINF